MPAAPASTVPRGAIRLALPIGTDDITAQIDAPDSAVRLCFGGIVAFGAFMFACKPPILHIVFTYGSSVGRPRGCFCLATVGSQPEPTA